MNSIDVVVILGGGVGNSLKPIFYTKERLEGFVKSLNKYQGIPIVVCGGQNFWLQNKLKYSEAEVMAHYLYNIGVPKKLIYKERRSRDTIGNVYYSKQIIKKHSRWKNILVVTTKGHSLRSKWLFKFIFGKKYSVSFLEIPSTIFSFKNNLARVQYEKYLVDVYRKVFKGARSGNDTEILEKMKIFYSHSSDSRELISEIVKTKKRLLGYTNLGKAK